MEEMIYLGAQWGSFEGRDGRKVQYCHVFVSMYFEDSGNPDYHHVGRKADKLKLDNPGMVQDLESGKKYRFYFNQKGKVTNIEPIPSSASK